MSAARMDFPGWPEATFPAQPQSGTNGEGIVDSAVQPNFNSGTTSCVAK
jgi:hypothetical protein